MISVPKLDLSAVSQQGDADEQVGSCSKEEVATIFSRDTTGGQSAIYSDDCITDDAWEASEGYGKQAEMVGSDAEKGLEFWKSEKDLEFCDTLSDEEFCRNSADSETEKGQEWVSTYESIAEPLAEVSARVGTSIYEIQEELCAAFQGFNTTVSTACETEHDDNSGKVEHETSAAIASTSTPSRGLTLPKPNDGSDESVCGGCEEETDQCSDLADARQSGQLDIPPVSYAVSSAVQLLCKRRVKADLDELLIDDSDEMEGKRAISLYNDVLSRIRSQVEAGFYDEPISINSETTRTFRPFKVYKDVDRYLAEIQHAFGEQAIRELVKMRREQLKNMRAQFVGHFVELTDRLQADGGQVSDLVVVSAEYLASAQRRMSSFLHGCSLLLGRRFMSD